MRPVYLIASGSALAAVAALFVGYRKAAETKNRVVEAVGGDADQAQIAAEKARVASTPADVQAAATQVQAAANAAPPSSSDVIDEADKAVAAAQKAKTPDEVRGAADQVQTVAAKMRGNSTVKIRATGYWPFTATEAERKMEGGVEGAAAWNGRRVVDPKTGKRIQLHTVEEYLEGKAPYFSISGDPEVWPFGQLLRVQWHDGRVIEGRVVDTGQHFTGSRKVYRAAGREPLDLCVYSKETKVLTKTSVVVVRGDHFDKVGRDLVASKLKGQTVVGALHMLGAQFAPLVDCISRGETFARLQGTGIKDGRGWGPYDTGYYVAEDGLECPLGPNGERLSEEYDFRCGPGGYLGGLRPPKKILPCGLSKGSEKALRECGVTAWDETGWYSMSKVLPQDGRPAKGWSQPRPDLMGPRVTPEGRQYKVAGALHMLGAG